MSSELRARQTKLSLRVSILISLIMRALSSHIPSFTDVLAARAAHLDAESKARSLTGTLQLKREELELQPEHWGRQGEFKALKGKCIEKNMGEYTYEFCFFGGTLQKPNKGGAQVGLG